MITFNTLAWARLCIIIGFSGGLTLSAACDSLKPVDSKLVTPAQTEAIAKSKAVEALYGHIERSIVTYGLRDVRAELHQTASHMFGKWVHVNLTQFYRGLRVYPADLAAQVEPDGTLHIISDSIVRNLELPSVAPKISGPEAEHVALAAARVLAAEDVKRELFVYCDTPSPDRGRSCVLAWQVTVDDGREGGLYWQYIIDATSGKLVASENLKKEASTTSGAKYTTLNVMYDTPFYEYCYFSGRYVYLQSPWFGTGVPSTTVSLANPGMFASNARQRTRGSTIIRNTTNSFGAGRLGTDVQTMGADAFLGLELTLQILRNIHQRDNLDGSNQWKVDARVNYPSNGANWVGGNCKCLELGTGDGSMYALVSQDIVAHELGHGLQEALGVLTGTNGETRALQEGYADILGTEIFIRMHRGVNGAVQTGDFWIGPKVFRSNYVNGAYIPTLAIRYMDDPGRADPTIPVCWSSTIGSLDPHRATLPFDHMYYLLANGGTSKCNSTVIAGIARDEVWNIAYLAMTSSTPTNVDYAQTKTLWINAATALYGAGPASAVSQAFAAIGVP